MPQNFLLIAIGGILAASWFIAPHLLASRKNVASNSAVITLYVLVCGIFLLFSGAKSAFVVVELGVLFTALGKLFALNLAMVHTSRHPKHQRCY